MVKVGLAEDGELLEEGDAAQMSLELDGKGIVRLAAVVRGYPEQRLGLDPIIVNG